MAGGGGGLARDNVEIRGKRGLFLVNEKGKWSAFQETGAHACTNSGRLHCALDFRVVRVFCLARPSNAHFFRTNKDVCSPFPPPTLPVFLLS